MAKVELKQPVVQEISERIQGAQSIVLVDHRGLTVEQDTQLRRELREAGVSYKVYKNTMMNFAFKGTEFEVTFPVSRKDPAQWQFPLQMQLLPQEFLQSLLRPLTSLKSRLVLLKEPYMMQPVSQLLQTFLPEKNLFPSYSEVCSPRLPTSLAS